MARSKAAGAKPRNDAYTGLLAISFLALVGASVLMWMDKESLGKPPDKLNIQVPGATPAGKSDGLRRPAENVAPAPAPGPMPMPMEEKKENMSMREPGKLPTLPAADATSDIRPVKAEEPAEGPPLPVKPFVPPQ